MEQLTQFVLEHGYLVLAVWVLLDQLGLPFPAIPIMIAVGGLAGGGQLDLATALLISTLACLPSDIFWYETGRRRGGAILRFLCKVSLEPDSCVRNTEDMFDRYGARSLLIAKFFPGFQTMAPPLAGMSRLPFARFLAFDIGGAFLWSAAFIGAGFALHDQLDRAYQMISELGAGAGAIIGVGLALWVAWKWVHRQLFLRSLRIARIGPDELKRMLDAGEDVSIVDLRSAIAFEMDPHRIPTAQVMSLEEIDQHHERIPRGRDIVLYCT